MANETKAASSPEPNRDSSNLQAIRELLNILACWATLDIEDRIAKADTFGDAARAKRLREFHASMGAALANVGARK